MKLFALLALLPALGWAHGEEKPGPHGGHVKMPGAFHVELNVDKDQSLHIFLLDMEFKNPTVKDSQISVSAKEGKKSTAFNCTVMGTNHFHCVPAQKYSTKSELIVKATREKAVGNEVVYNLPLKEFTPKEAPHDGH